MNEFDTLIGFGGSAKALDDSARRVGGYLVLFGSADDTDLQGEFFSKATDFGNKTTDQIRFHHGRDPELGICPMGDVELSLKAEGVWCEGNIAIKAVDAKRWAAGIAEKREQYEQRVYELAKAGKLGWSSGTAAHLVRTMSRGKAREILSWPLGNDATLSPTPVDPRNVAVIPMKALDWSNAALKGMHLGDYAGPEAAYSAMNSLHNAAQTRVGMHMRDKSRSRDEREAACKGCLDEYHSSAMKCCKALMDDDDDESGEAVKSLVDNALSRLHDGLRLGDQLDLVRATVSGLHGRLKGLADLRLTQGRNLSAERSAAIKALADDLAKLSAACRPKVDAQEVLRLKAELLRLTN